MSEASERIRLLHVDDNPEITELTETFLERAGGQFDVRTARDVDEALERMADRSFDCIVSDYDMPGQTGIELLEAVRERDSELPFILYTGKGSEEVASEAISAGVTDYLQKGTGTDQYDLLANRIQNAVEQFRSNRRANEQNRINSVVRQINEALARAATQREVDERVCEIISDAEPYRFAWIGEHSPESGTVEPRASAGIEENYLEAIEITTDETPTGQGPTGQAVRTHELVLMENIPGDPDYEPWREQALERGYQSSAAVPLVYDDTLYGVLNVYADRTRAFDDDEKQLLSNLGETIAHASHRIDLQQQYTDQYRVLFEDAPVMVVFTEAVDGEPIIEDCNPAFAERLGYTQKELRGTPLARYYTDESAEKLLGRDGYQRALSGEFVREQRALVSRDGEEVLTILRASPRRDREGEITGTHALYLDITDQQLVTELQRQNERLDEFASVISHDLRNPLNVATSRLELASDECESEHLEHVEQAHRRMETLIEDLLQLARADEREVNYRTISLATVIEECWETVETTGSTLVADTQKQVLADETQLKQLFENLIRNAVEHGSTSPQSQAPADDGGASSSKPSVADAPEDAVEHGSTSSRMGSDDAVEHGGESTTIRIGDLTDGFYVEDDGPGIPEEKRNQVFEAGYSTTRDGTGFGLRIVTQIVEEHGWEIDLGESAEGGARFEITGVETASG